MRRMVVKNPTNMTKQERMTCYGMSFKHNGDLLKWLVTSNDPQRAGDKVVLVRDGDTVIAWAYRRKEGDVGFWVRPAYRGQGIGTKMVKRVEKMGKIKTCPHDYKSAKLFNSTNTLPRGQVNTWRRVIKNRELNGQN